MVYYNEFDPYAAQWLRNLIDAGHIAKGDVDERSIKDVKPDDLRGYTQCHFFAGIGVWSYALRLAGWPDDRPVWTGSCPCQPFSAAGKGKGTADERHLWPVWFNLIRECRPGVVFGEQVEAAVRHGWLDLVQSDLEGSGYTTGAAGVPAAGVGAPHIRARLWFVAKSVVNPCDQRYERSSGTGRHAQRRAEYASGVSGLAHAEPAGSQGWLRGRPDQGREDQHGHAGCGGAVGGLADAEHAGSSRAGGDAQSESAEQQSRNADREEGATAAGPTNGHWRDADWLYCRDGKWRPVEPGTFPLAHGSAARVGRLRAYGNAIVAQVAQVFIEAYLDS